MGFARYPRALRQKAGRGLALWLALVIGGGGLAPACRRAASPGQPATSAVGGTVTRSVTAAAAGAPVAGAIVILSSDPDDGRVPFASVKSGASGTFRIGRIPAGSYLLRVRSPGFVDATAHLQVRPSTDKFLDLKLAPTVSLAGRIQDGRGAPIPLARVLAFAVADATSSKVNETRADEHGAFEVTGLAAGAHRLLIEAPGLGTASAGPVQAPDHTVVVVLPGEIRTIVGRVSRVGQVVAGAHVLLGGEALTDTRTVDSDGEGRFVFAGLGPGSYTLRAESGGLVSPVVKEVVLDAGPQTAARPPARVRARTQAAAAPPPRQVDLALVPGLYARGRVIGEGGLPVAAASVTVDMVPALGLWPAITTDGQGNWTSAPLGPGNYRIRARHDGFVARRIATLTLPAGGAPGAAAPLPPVVLELMRTGEITGRVVDDRGRPVAGATVHDRLAETEELGVIWARLPLAAEAAAMPQGTILPLAAAKTSSRRATTDAAGRFFLRDVPPGRVQVEVLNAASVPLRTNAVTLAAGGRLDVGTLNLHGAVQLVGRVVDFDGNPVAGARVNAVAVVGGSDALGGLYAISGGDGGFSLPLPAGDHRLTATAPGHGDVTATVHVTAAAAAPPTTLRLARGGSAAAVAGAAAGSATSVTLDGAVRDTDGRPLARARLSVRCLVPAGAPSVVTGVTNAGGAFHLTGVPAQQVIVEIQHDGYPPHRHNVDLRVATGGVRSEQIVVPLPGGIDGEVHERISGAPVPKFQIEAQGPDGARARFPETNAAKKRTSSEPLRFSLRRLAPGRWTLRVQAAGYRPVEKSVEVVSASSPGDASVRDLRLELERS